MVVPSPGSRLPAPADRARAGVPGFLAALPGRPKAELHLHLEGSISPVTAVRLSRRFAHPAFPDLAAFRARRSFGGFRAFLDLYRDVCRLLKGPRDYALVARDLVRRLRREGITYAEVYVSPAVVEKMGLDWVAVRDSLEAVFRRHEEAGHGAIRVLLDSVRQWGPDAAARVLDLHRDNPWPRAVGFGLGGDETSVPAREFRGIYRRLPSLRLRGVVHAGEWGGPDSVADALLWLRPARVAHGVAAAADPALVRALARRQVPLDVCLASNAATGATPPGVRHPALDLLRAGVPVTLSTDDPTLFGVTLRGEYRRLARLGATRRELEAVLRGGFAAALAPPTPRGPAHRSRGSGPPSRRR